MFSEFKTQLEKLAAGVERQRVSSQSYFTTDLDQLAAAVHEIRSKVRFLLGLQGSEVLEVSRRPAGCNGSQIGHSGHSGPGKWIL